MKIHPSTMQQHHHMILPGQQTTTRNQHTKRHKYTSTSGRTETYQNEIIIEIYLDGMSPYVLSRFMYFKTSLGKWKWEPLHK